MREYGSEHTCITIPDRYFETFNNFGSDVIYLRTGREALMYISSVSKVKKKSLVLMPAYSCWSMLISFIKTDWEIKYYKLNNDLTVDLDYLSKLLRDYLPDAILTINYFGSTSTSMAIEMSKNIVKNIIVIEDFTHYTFNFESNYNPLVDYYVSSIRKSIGICDGAVIISKYEKNRSIIQPSNTLTIEKKFAAQKKKWQYSFTKDIKSKDGFLEEFKHCEEIINNFQTVSEISDKSKEMLSLINGKEIAYSRLENTKHLYNILYNKVRLLSGIERCFDGAPFSLPIIVENRDELQTKLAIKGLYSQVIWPINNEARLTCSNSSYISDHILSIPIDQRFNWDDIEDIGQIVLNAII